MLKVRTMKSALSLFLTVCMVVSLFAVTAVPAFAADTMEVVKDAGLAKVPDPIDPQSWSLNRDLTWNDYNPNPVIDWMSELNPKSLNNKFAWGSPANPNKPIVGGLMLFEYLDRPFISRGLEGSDPLGYYMYEQDGSGMQSTITKNPVLDVPQLIADEEGIARADVTDAMFAQWWADFLNTPSEINKFAGIDEFWREASYGKWATTLIPKGPFTIPYFEFETMGYDINSNFQSYNDIPPSFRHGDLEGIRNEVLTELELTYTTANIIQIEPEVTRRMRLLNSTGPRTVSPTVTEAARPQAEWDRDYTVNAIDRRFDTVAHQLAKDSGVDYDEFDFFFLLHAGYDESGVWQEFGQAQYPTRKDVPEELGPKNRMLKVVEVFQSSPNLLEIYAERYENTTNHFFKNEYAEWLAAGSPVPYTAFDLPQEDWDWVAGYNDITTRNTRYIDFTAWEAAVGEWSHAGSYTHNGRSIPRSTQGESDGMSTFAHEFGHISNIRDNYGNPWEDVSSAATEPWELMSRGSFAGPFGDHARWTVPGVEAASIPTHLMQFNKDVKLEFFDDGDLLEFKSMQELINKTPVVANIVSRNLPLADDVFYPKLAEQGLTQENFVKGIKLNFGEWQDKSEFTAVGFTNLRRAAKGITVEVVDQSGYDSFLNDHGVLIGRTHALETPNPSHTVVDSHLGDIAMIDFELNGEYAAYPLAHATQLADAAFHAGISTTDTGYYATKYALGSDGKPVVEKIMPDGLNKDRQAAWPLNPANWKIEKAGSFAKGEPRDGRDIVSGNTVNEYYDKANGVHIYILEKNLNDGKYDKYLSYQVGILHDNGRPSSGTLTVTPTKLTTADAGKVAVQEFTVKNNGTTTDIIRIELGGTLSWEKTILNNLFAIEAGKEITVKVYIDVEAAGDPIPNETLIFTASSESNEYKKTVVTLSQMVKAIVNGEAPVVSIVVTEPPVVPPPQGGSGGGSGGSGTPAPTTPAETPKDPEVPEDTTTTGTGSGSGTGSTPALPVVGDFTDVSPTDWFYDDIIFVLARGLFKGTSASDFSPNTPMTRGMLVTVLGRLEGINTNRFGASDFGDVNPDEYYSPYIAWAAEEGIVLGIGEGLFAPDSEISRQDFAVILVRYLAMRGIELPVIREAIEFGDTEGFADYAQEAIMTLYCAGIVNGSENADGGFDFIPEGSATRAEVAAMLHRLVNAIEGIDVTDAVATLEEEVEEVVEEEAEEVEDEEIDR